MYNMAKDTYECDFCGWEEPWDASDDDHGSMWECEDCGKHFCTKCFTDRWGRKAWDKMVQGMVGSFETERLFCPECYGEIIRDYPEKGGVNMTYTDTVKIKASEFDRINRLLHIYSLEEMTDEELQDAGANTHHCEGVFTAHFADGSTMNYDLCSGTENYYDDVVWASPDGSRDVIIDCEFELSDDIEVEIDGNLYIVKIEKEA